MAVAIGVVVLATAGRSQSAFGLVSGVGVLALYVVRAAARTRHRVLADGDGFGLRGLPQSMAVARGRRRAVCIGIAAHIGQMRRARER